MPKKLIETAWQQKNALYYLALVPLSWLFTAITALRRNLYRIGILTSHKIAVPVIVVGNIHMGGNGKTPVVIYLVEQLRKNGYEPAVISRGYGGNITAPTSVNANSHAANVGDEPVLIAHKCACPVWVGANRVAVANALLQAHTNTNIIISDDGLQHYALQRDIEIAVITPEQMRDNMLPAGPLREPLKRLNTVHAIVCNGEAIEISQAHAKIFAMQLTGETFCNLQEPNKKASAADFANKNITAIAGIGKPARFFAQLSKLGLVFNSISFADHHAFSANELSQIESDILIMTEKDAVKCAKFAQSHYWVLPVQAQIEDGLLALILNQLKR